MTDSGALIVSLPEPRALIRGLREVLPLATTTTGGTGFDTAVRVINTEAVFLSTGSQTVTNTDEHTLISDSTDSVSFMADQIVIGMDDRHTLIHHAPMTGTVRPRYGSPDWRPEHRASVQNSRYMPSEHLDSGPRRREYVDLPAPPLSPSSDRRVHFQKKQVIPAEWGPTIIRHWGQET